MGKVVASTLKEQIKEAAGPLQTCASHGAGGSHPQLRIHDGRSGSINLAVPMTSLQCQRQNFFYQSTVLWNKYYKKLLTPSKAVLHSDHTTALNLTSSEVVFFDFSTNVGSFKIRLRNMLHLLQSSGDETSWSELNYHKRAV